MGKETQSAITEYTELSAFSGAPAQARHHCIFGRGLRELADEDQLWIPLTHAEHDLNPDGYLYQIHGNPPAEKLSKMLGQMAFEKAYYRRYSEYEEDVAREAFRKRYGISYL